MNEEQMAKLFQTLGEIKGTQEQILKKQDSTCAILRDHEERIRNVETVQERHRTYFKLIGSAVAIIAAVFGTIVAWFKS